MYESTAAYKTKSKGLVHAINHLEFFLVLRVGEEISQIWNLIKNSRYPSILRPLPQSFSIFFLIAVGLYPIHWETLIYQKGVSKSSMLVSNIVTVA